MEKLLHERLISFARNFSCQDAAGIFYSPGEYSLTMYKEEAETLADEIERYYIPRPRDNAGIPFVEGETIYSVDPDTEYSAEVVRINANQLYVCWEDLAYDWVDACEMQHEKPDSLEKLLDDMKVYVETNVGLGITAQFVERFAALMDKEEQ